LIPEVKIKLFRPATWKIVPAKLPAADSILLATMFKQSEGSHPSVIILVNQVSPNINNAPINVREYVESNITVLKNKHDDFDLIESVPSTLGGNNALRATYEPGGAKHFSIV
jgi:hypothetical protein